MKSNFEPCLELVLDHEGLWSDDPRDPGGATMQGITLNTYSEYLGRDATKDELRNIPNNHKEDIYRRKYWNLCWCDDLPSGLDMVVFDMAVHSGPGRAIKILQSIVGTKVDGAIGPKTLGCVEEFVLDCGIAHIINDYQDARQHYLEALPVFATYGKGFTRRVSKTRNVALKMANG